MTINSPVVLIQLFPPLPYNQSILALTSSILLQIPSISLLESNLDSYCNFTSPTHTKLYTKQNNFLNYTSMTSINYQSNTMANSSKQQLQQNTQTSVRSKNQPLSFTKPYCEIHSTPSKKQPIHFINVNYFEPKQRKTTSINLPFLCQLCITKIKSQKSSNQALKHIKTLKEFSNQYIGSVFQKYSTFQNPKHFQDKMLLLQKTQVFFNSQIDKMMASCTQALSNYKRKFSEIFMAFIEPFNQKKLQLFQNGFFNQQTIRQFYTNSQKIQSFQSLIGDKNQELVQKAGEGLKQALESMSKQINHQLFSSQNLLKSVIQLYKSEQLYEKFKTINITNSNNQNSILKRIKAIKEQRKKQLLINKPIRISSMSQNRHNNSQSNRMSQERIDSSSSNRRRDNEIRPAKKHKYIRKQRLEKPSRCNDVHVVCEDYIFKDNMVVVLYIVNKTHTERVDSERVNQIPREEFKRKYPESYRVYQREVLAKRARSS